MYARLWFSYFFYGRAAIRATTLTAKQTKKGVPRPPISKRYEWYSRRCSLPPSLDLRAALRRIALPWDLPRVSLSETLACKASLATHRRLRLLLGEGLERGQFLDVRVAKLEELRENAELQLVKINR